MFKSKKKCSKCKLVKNKTEFNRCNTRGDGFRSSCRECDRQINYLSRDKVNLKIKTPKSRFSHAISRAKRREIEWGLTLNQWTDLVMDKSCHYCSGPLQKTGVGLDRIDNHKGYICNNVLPCCVAGNRRKGQVLSYEEMVAVASLLKQMRSLAKSDKMPHELTSIPPLASPQDLKA